MICDEVVLDTLLNCTIANRYEGLDQFKLFAQDRPDEALAIIWKVLTHREDPGRDDGALCHELLATVTDMGRREALEKIILTEWPTMSDGLRRNVTEGAGSLKAMSTAFGLQLFELPETRVEQRHHLVAGFVAGDRNRKCEDFIVELAKRIGTYAEPYRQEILDGFVQDVIRHYG